MAFSSRDVSISHMREISKSQRCQIPILPASMVINTYPNISLTLLKDCADEDSFQNDLDSL
jgi:hypothetical protein